MLPEHSPHPQGAQQGSDGQFRQIDDRLNLNTPSTDADHGYRPANRRSPAPAASASVVLRAFAAPEAETARPFPGSSRDDEVIPEPFGLGKKPL